MLKKILLIGAFSLISTGAMAACFVQTATTCHPASKYEVEIQKVELCTTSSCSNPVVVASSVQSFDIAAAGVGAAVGEYASLDDVPAGIYTHVRTTIDNELTYSAAAVTGCTTAVTDANHTYTSNATFDATLANNNSTFGITWNTGNTAFEHVHELSTPLAISKAGSLPQVQVDFATQEAALCVGGTFYPGIPEITISVIAN
ncbi:MAG: hypothetical protein ACON4F_02565 [Candidatus Puniceispirillaceae bacterium]